MIARMPVAVRSAAAADVETLMEQFSDLWKDDPPAEHRALIDALLAGTVSGPYPAALLVADDGGRVTGFVVVGERSHADGCDERHPVGYVEGWYVVPGARATGVGRALIDAAEAWARAQGCREMASDTWHDNEPSILAHQALGYELVEHVVLFRKAL